MDSKISKTGPFGRTVEVSATVAELEPYFDRAFNDFRKKVKLEGFRKGKVPMPLIKRMYGEAIRVEALDEIVNDLFRAICVEQDLRPVAPAKVEDIDYKPGGGLSFKAFVEVEPEIELKKYKGISAERPIYVVDDQDVTDALEDVREQMAVMEPVEDAARENHIVVGDIQGVDPSGVPLIGTRYDDRLLVLNRENDFSAAVTEQLLGVRQGEMRRIEIDENGSAGEGRSYYQVAVKEIKEKKLPALDDELAKDLGKFETLEELRNDIRSRLEKQSAANARKSLRNGLIEDLLKQNSFDLPEAMINNYLEILAKDASKDKQVSDEQIKEYLRPDAIRHIKWQLAKDKLQALENVTIGEEDKEAYYDEVAKDRGIDRKEVKKAFKGPKNQGRLEFDLLERKILDILEANAKIKERKITRKDREKTARKNRLF